MHIETFRLRIIASVTSLLVALSSTMSAHAAPPTPTHKDVSYGTHPNQTIDIYLPTSGAGPYPVVVWYGGIWKPAKNAARPPYFNDAGIAVVAVQTRTMNDAVADQEPVPVSYVLDDACRVVQFLRTKAGEWNLNPDRIGTGGGSQGALPALYVGCSADRADPNASDPVLRQSSRVTCVAAYRCQPTIDPRRMQEWVAGVKWGAPALGMSFDESLKKRDELQPLLDKWSPDWLLHKGAAPMYFENEWGLTKPADITQPNYDTHCPAWAIGFKKVADAAGATCYVKHPEHPTDGYADIWDFLVKELKKKP